MNESRRKSREENQESVTVKKYMTQGKVMFKIEFKFGNKTMEEEK